MSSRPNFSIDFSAPLHSTAASGTKGTVLIDHPDGSGRFVVATSGNRSGGRRSVGIALASFDSDDTVAIQEIGLVDRSVVNLGPGAAGWVRVSSAGQLERVASPDPVLDDLIGKCNDAGTVFLTPYASNEVGNGIPTTSTIGLSVAYNEDGTLSDKRKKVAHTGSHDVHDYGAIGDGTTDDGAAFLATLAAINPDNNYLDQLGSRILLKERTDYKIENFLRLYASITLQGASSSSSPFSTPSTRLVFGNGSRGIGGQGVYLPGIRGSNRCWANGTMLKDLGIVPSLLVTPPSAFPYDTTITATNPATPVSNATYVQETRREYVYECIRTGKTPKRPWPAWEASVAYIVGDKICADNGHVYRVVEVKGTGVSGTTIPIYTAGIQSARVYNGGTDFPFYYDELIWDGEWTGVAPDITAGTNGVIWEECGFWHEIGHLHMKPFVDAHDPRIKWTPGQAYEWGDVVWVDSVGGGDPVGRGPSSLPTYTAQNAVAFKVKNQGGLLVGGTAGSTRPTGGAVDTTVSDGGIEWTRVTNAFFWVPQPTAEVVSTAGTYNSSWVGGETLTIGRDAEANQVITFAAGDDASLNACIAKINASYPSNQPIVDHNGRAQANKLRFRALVRESAGQVRIVAGSAGVLTKLGLTAGTTVGEDGPILLARFHGGISADYVHDIDNVLIYGGENDLYHCYADGAAPVSGNSNFSFLSRLGGSQGKGAFIRLRGGDCNSLTIVSPRVWSGFGSQYKEANTAFADESLGGATWVGACSDNHYGYSAYRGFIPTYSELTRTYQAQSFGNGAKFFGGHYEGGRCFSISGGQITGAAVVRTRRSNFVDLETGKGLFGSTGHDRTDIAVGSGVVIGDKRVDVRTYVGGQDGSSTSPKLITLGFQAVESFSGYEGGPQGFTLSNWLRTPHSANPFPCNWNGFYMWCFNPDIYGALLAPFALSTDKSPFWKDDADNAAGRLWIGKHGFFVGEMYGATVPWTMRWLTDKPSTGTWRRGDIIWDGDSTEAIGWRCDTAGTPGTWRAFGRTLGPVDKSHARVASWKDDAYTQASAGGKDSDKASARSYRVQKTTTTATANQVIDDGGTIDGEDFTLLDQCVTHVVWVVIVKKLDEAEGGVVEVKATYIRDDGGAPNLIGSASVTPTLEGTTLDGLLLHPEINGNKIELQADPESADDLRFRIFRTQYEGVE